jgi:hypothetical protein
MYVFWIATWIDESSFMIFPILKIDFLGTECAELRTFLLLIYSHKSIKSIRLQMYLMGFIKKGIEKVILLAVPCNFCLRRL